MEEKKQYNNLKKKNILISLETWSEIETMTEKDKTYFMEVERGSEEWNEVQKAMNVKV